MRSRIIKNRTRPNSIGALFISAMAVLLFTGIGEASSPGDNVFNYQARVVVNGVNVDGPGDCRFAIIDDSSQILWSNSMLNAGVPDMGISCQVSNGLVSVLLGDTGLTNMDPIPDSVLLDHEILYLRFWFNSQQLSPDQRIAPSARVLVAREVDNLADGSVDTAQLVDGAVTGDKIGSETITGNNIVNGSVDLDELDSGDVDTRYVNRDGDTMAGPIDMGGYNINGVGPGIAADGPLSVSAEGGTNDLDLNSDRDINLNALNGDINLNASDSTIMAKANTRITGTLGVTVEDTLLGDTTNVLTLTHTISGNTGGDLIGSGILFQVEDGNGVIEDVGAVGTIGLGNEPNLEGSEIEFLVRDNGGILRRRMTLSGPEGDLFVSGGLEVSGGGDFGGNVDLNGFNLTDVGGLSQNAGGEFAKLVPGGVQSISSAATSLIHLRENDGGNAPKLIELEVGHGI